jgi:hypothetical protein
MGCNARKTNKQTKLVVYNVTTWSWKVKI